MEEREVGGGGGGREKEEGSTVRHFTRCIYIYRVFPVCLSKIYVWEQKKKSLGMTLNDSIFTVIYYIFIQFNTLNFVII